MRFLIRGLHPNDGVISLTTDAVSIDEARAQATARGIHIIAIDRDWRDRWRKTARREFDLLLFSQELHALLGAGLSLIEAIGAITRKEDPSPKRTLTEHLLRHLREGKPLSEALRAHPDRFPPLYLALIAASEKTGDLHHALQRFITYQTQMDGIRKRVVTAAIYPALLIGVGGLVILFLMTYVVPRFTRIYEDFGRDLPLMSRLLLEWGHLVSDHGAGLLIGLVACLGVGFRMLRSAPGQGLFRLVLGHPQLKRRLQDYELARFYRTTGMLQQGGIPLITALDMAAPLLGATLRPALSGATHAIQGGLAFSGAMEAQGLAPPVALDLLKVGEKSGALGQAMLHIADFYDEALARWVERATRLFEPLLMLFIGCFIAFVVVLLYLPIFELAGNLQ